MPRKPTVTPENRFDRAPPGYSLTGPKGQYPWERPPKHNTPPEAVDAIIDNLEKPDVQEYYVQLLAAGVSIEEMVGTMARVGFMEGQFTVDVAELIKAPLAYYLMGLAADAGVPANVFKTKDGMPRTNYGMKDGQLLNLMRRRNPDFADYMVRRLPQEIVQERDQRMMEEEEVREKRGDGGFISMPDVVEGNFTEVE